jgi:hypothetical protein
MTTTLDPKFFNKDGSLTSYSFSCGYMQKKGNFTLWKQHYCYHIAGRNIEGKQVWESTDSLTEARKLLRKLGKGKMS